ncbi:MAG: PD-(D/E)XK nuclease family protein [Planctomycetota bacterium]|jgi:ATP-dependent helicase/nuclease subunit B
MAIQFILGRSGTGKTSYCLKAIINALAEPGDQRLILLVPEQATYQAERAILADRKIAGYHRLHVLSFDRLQFLLLGKNTARAALTRIGQQMIVHRLLRENARNLKLFGSSADWTGLSRQMAETVVELHEYAKTAQDIDQLLSELDGDRHNSLAALKFADIGLIFKEYLKAVEGKFVDPDMQLNQARRAVAEAGFLKEARLWVDGFAGFTAAELAILSELLKTIADAQIALCLDPSRLDLSNPQMSGPEHFGLFSPTERTYSDLYEIIKKSEQKLVEPIVLTTGARFVDCSQLAHIERGVFEPAPSTVEAAESIRLISAPNARAEAQFVAAQIVKLVKDKEYRYRDIAVIASNVGRYEHYIRAYFDDYGIPFFIDKRRALNQHPVIHLICSALQVVTGGFSHYDICSYLKTDLIPADRSDIDLLENYCLVFGTGGADWQGDKDWNFAGEEEQDFDERRVNQIRQEVSGPLLKLWERLCPSGNPAGISADEFTQIIFDFLDSLQTPQKLGDWIEKATEAEDYSEVEEHRQFYDKLLTVFDELAEVFADRMMTAEDYLAILNSAFSQMTLAFIPPTLDQVLVGSIERSRHPDLKAVFLIGATQRQFPTPVVAAGILTDDDRKAAESADFALAPSARQKLLERQYLAYIAFTRPSQLLYVIYPLVDDKGGPECPSQFVTNLKSLFDDLNEECIAADRIDTEDAHTRHGLIDLLCGGLGRDALRESAQHSREALDELLDDVCADEDLADVGSTVVSALSYDNCARLDKRVVEKLFGPELRSSATRLGTFAACPYRYFARYVLELQERKEFKFEPLDVGVFYHKVLDMLSKAIAAERKDFAKIEDECLLRLLQEQVKKLFQTDSFVSHFARHSRHNAFIIDSASEVLEDCVRAIAQMVRAGSFRPSRSEVSFGQVKDTHDTLGDYRIRLSNNRVMLLAGKIDRLDIANVNNRKVAIVFDYKRRPKSFNWSQFYYGLDMQLPIYMLAVRSTSADQADVVGAFYMPVEVSPGKAAFEEALSKAESFAYKAKGIFSGKFARQLDENASKDSSFYNFYVTKEGEPYGSYGNRGALRPADFETLLKFTGNKMGELAKEILSGRIDVNPYRLGSLSPCSYCKYKPVCRFDWQINDYNPLESLSKIDVLEAIEATDG